jgi:hypothetical protein
MASTNVFIEYLPFLGDWSSPPRTGVREPHRATFCAGEVAHGVFLSDRRKVERAVSCGSSAHAETIEVASAACHGPPIRLHVISFRYGMNRRPGAMSRAWVKYLRDSAAGEEPPEAEIDMAVDQCPERR